MHIHTYKGIYKIIKENEAMSLRVSKGHSGEVGEKQAKGGNDVDIF